MKVSCPRCQRWVGSSCLLIFWLLFAVGTLLGQETSLPPSTEPTVSATGPAVVPPPSFLFLLRKDATHMVTAPIRWDRGTWTKVGLGLGGVVVLMRADEMVRDEMRQNSGRPIHRVAEFVEPFGSDYSWFVLAAFYGAGRFLDDSRASAIAQDGLVSSLIAAGVITPIVKEGVGRSRPSQSDEEFNFQGKGKSFPSGHATQAFAIASVVAAHCDVLWVDALAYGVASMVGYSRMASEAHFLSDVVAGAVIGILVGRTVVRLNSGHRRIRLQPAFTNGGAGFSVRFDLSALRRKRG